MQLSTVESLSLPLSLSLADVLCKALAVITQPNAASLLNHRKQHKAACGGALSLQSIPATALSTTSAAAGASRSAVAVVGRCGYCCVCFTRAGVVRKWWGKRTQQMPSRIPRRFEMAKPVLDMACLSPLSFLSLSSAVCPGAALLRAAAESSSADRGTAPAPKLREERRPTSTHIVLVKESASPLPLALTAFALVKVSPSLIPPTYVKQGAVCSSSAACVGKGQRIVGSETGSEASAEAGHTPPPLAVPSPFLASSLYTRAGSAHRPHGNSAGLRPVGEAHTPEDRAGETVRKIGAQKGERNKSGRAAVRTAARRRLIAPQLPSEHKPTVETAPKQRRAGERERREREKREKQRERKSGRE